MTKIKSSKSDLDSDSEPNATAADNGKHIIDANPTATVATAQIQLEDPEESEAGVPIPLADVGEGDASTFCC